MSAPYTYGIWKVKPGREDEFIAAWSEFADWSFANAPGAQWAKMLRDTADRNVFITFSPWESLDAIGAWRELPGWRDRVARIQELLESFEPRTLEVVIERG